jgi:hypothetical protein
MSTYSDASLIMPVAPNIKAGKIYCLKPTDGTGDFTFSRASSATRVNSEGLIETVGSNIPRLNYPMIDGVVSGCPSLLLEPSRSNLVTYSEDFTQSAWVKTRVSISSNVIVSPYGTLNADKIISDATLNSHFIRDDISSTIGVVSVFAKADEFTFLKLSTNAFGFQASYFDLVNGTFVQSADHIAKIENYGNGWFRCSIYVSQAFTQFYVENAGNSASATHLGDGVSGIYIWGAQVEAGSYPTSYIPTNGSSVTRSAETCNGAGDATTFNDSEGVLYYEGTVSESEGNYRSINLGNGVNPETALSLRFDFPLSSNSMAALFYNGSGFSAVLIHTFLDITNVNKIAFRYAANNFGLFVNGVKVAQSLTGGTGGVNLSNLAFNNGVSGANFYGSAKDLRVYNTALTDAELIALTQ